MLRIVGMMGIMMGWMVSAGARADSPAPTAIASNSARMNGIAIQQRSSVDLQRRIHAHDPQRLHWQLSDPSLPENVADAAASFNAGGAVWLTLPAPATLIPAGTESQDVIFYHGDHLGSAAVMTDRHGALIKETAYYPFGDVRHSHEPTVTSRPPYGFTGKEQDAESDLYYFEARYLTSTLSRFVTVDPKFANPARLSSEQLAAYLSKPQKANAYGYALNNPLMHTDPTGLDEEDQVARSVVEGLKQVNSKTGAFAEIVKTYDKPMVHWIFVDDQSSVTLEKDRPPRWSDGGRRYPPAKPERNPEDSIRPQYSFPDRDEWESLPESDKSAHEDAYDGARNRAVEIYRENAVSHERFRKSLEKQSQFLPLMD